MTTPLVSIIIPVYNSEHYISRCLDSIIGQTYTNFELILIDDCSSDNSASICDSYQKKDNRIRFIKKKENEGVTITRNKGLDNAKGDYIIFIDNDDYIDNNYISTFIDSINNNKGYDLYTQNIFFHYEGKDPYIVSDQQTLGGPWGKLFKKDIIEKNKIKFIPHLKYNEDNLFLLDYLEHSNSLYNIQYAGYHYIIHNECTSKKLEDNYSATSIGLILILERIEKDNFKNEYNRSFANNRCHFIFYRYISALYSYPFKNINKRKRNFYMVLRSAKYSYKYYPNTYKLDRIIKFLIKYKIYYLAFYINEIIYSIRINTSIKQ